MNRTLRGWPFALLGDPINDPKPNGESIDDPRPNGDPIDSPKPNGW